jgi:hypothetical protein
MLSIERRCDGLSVRVGSLRESLLKAKVREERFMYRPEKASNRTTVMTTSFGSLRIPLLGLGVWEVANGPETENAVHWALELAARTGPARSRTPRRRGS